MWRRSLYYCVACPSPHTQEHAPSLLLTGVFSDLPVTAFPKATRVKRTQAIGARIKGRDTRRGNGAAALRTFLGEGFPLVMVLAAGLALTVQAEAQILRRLWERFAGAARPEW
jgi:hypothetical protein